VKVPECIQRKAAKLVEGLEGVSCEERLRTLGLERRRPGGDHPHGGVPLLSLTTKGIQISDSRASSTYFS